jgi:hypothetical protein
MANIVFRLRQAMAINFRTTREFAYAILPTSGLFSRFAPEAFAIEAFAIFRKLCAGSPFRKRVSRATRATPTPGGL